MEQTKFIEETPESILNILNQIKSTASEEQLQNVFNRLSGMTISAACAEEAFNIVFDWREYVDADTRDVFADIIRPTFKVMGCTIV